jgi:tetratricopeptide (TPR) repeat protein
MTLSLEKFKQAILIGSCPIMAQYNVALLLEDHPNVALVDKQNAWNLLLESASVLSKQKGNASKILVRSNRERSKLLSPYHIQHRLARLAQEQGHFREAAEQLKEIVAAGENGTHLDLTVSLTALSKELIAVLICCKDYEEAMKRCNQLLRVEPSDIVTLLLTSDVLRLMNKHNEALQHCRSSLNLLNQHQQKELEKKTPLLELPSSTRKQSKSKIDDSNSIANIRRLKVSSVVTSDSQV